MAVTVKSTSAVAATVTAAAQGVTRLDAYVGLRPIHTVGVQNGHATFSVKKPDSSRVALEILEHDGSLMVAGYRTSL